MDDAEHVDSFLPAFARAYWMMLGNAVLLVLALVIARRPTWTPGWPDAIYLLGLAALPLSRWYDVTYCRGTTADGAPMTRAQLVRYIVVAIVVGVAGWGLVQSIEL